MARCRPGLTGTNAPAFDRGRPATMPPAFGRGLSAPTPRHGPGLIRYGRGLTGNYAPASGGADQPR